MSESCMSELCYPQRLSGRCGLTSVPKETKHTWDKLFKEAYAADVRIITEDEAIIPAHFIVLDRVLTVRENARLQGFPDCYKLFGPVKESSDNIALGTIREFL